MTSYYNVKNSVYPATVTTIRHCSILEFGWEAYNQAVTPDITRPLHATGDDLRQTKGYYCLNEDNCFESRCCFTSPSYDHLLYLTKLWSLAQWPAGAAQQLGTCLRNFAVRERSIIILKYIFIMQGSPNTREKNIANVFHYVTTETLSREYKPVCGSSSFSRHLSKKHLGISLSSTTQSSLYFSSKHKIEKSNSKASRHGDNYPVKMLRS